MMELQVLELLNTKINDRKQELIEVIAEGISDFAKYRELCGVIRGLATAQMEIDGLVRRYKEDDDE